MQQCKQGETTFKKLKKWIFHTLGVALAMAFFFFFFALSS